MRRVGQAPEDNRADGRAHEQDRRAASRSTEQARGQVVRAGSRRRGTSSPDAGLDLIARRVAFRKTHEPGAADVEVDGVSSRPTFDDPAWGDEKEAAVRRVLACIINSPENVPDIGRRVETVVRRPGQVNIRFDDGSEIGASVDDPGPATNEEAAAVECIYGDRPRSTGHTAAAETVDMVAAVRDGEMLGAMDVGRRGSQDPRFWKLHVDAPFDLYMLHDVPLALAVPLADFGTRATRLHDPGQAWVVARRFAEPRPARRVQT